MNSINVCRDWIPGRKIVRKPITINANGNHSSLHGWLQTADFNQSKHIVSGLFVQDFIHELLMNSDAVDEAYVSNIAVNTANKRREVDECFRVGNTWYVVEVKGNVNLDSEKYPAVKQKLAQIVGALRKELEGTIQSMLLCPSWLTSDKEIEGLNSFLARIGGEQLSIEEHQQLGRMLGDKIRAVLA